MTTDKPFGDFDMRIKHLCCDYFYKLALRLRQPGCHAKD
jgi:hypothetical protein